MRLGIFGGSFDPVHNGHLALVRACQSQAALDEIWFTPTAIQPLKRGGPRATDAQRIEMLELAIATLGSEQGRGHRRAAMLGPRSEEHGEPGRPRRRHVWRVCTLEIDRGGLSYTVDTLRQIHTELPEAKLYFLIGADAVRDVPHWKEPAEIFRLATPLVVHRARESQADLTPLAKICPPENQPRLIPMPAVDISSSEIRRRVVAGESIDSFVPADVARYIAEHGLYR